MAEKAKLIRSDTRQWSSGAVRLALISVPGHDDFNYIVMEKVFFGRSKNQPQKFLLRSHDWENLKRVVEGTDETDYGNDLGWVSPSITDQELAAAVASKPELVEIVLGAENLGKFSQASIEALDRLGAKIFEIQQDQLELILKRLAESTTSTLTEFSHLLKDLRLSQISLLSNLIYQKLRTLDLLEQVTSDPENSERAVHEIFETNPWLLGSEYEIVQSDKSLATYLDSKVKDDPDTRKRPDLIVRRVPNNDEIVLIELKAPGVKLSAQHIGQVLEYKALIQSNKPGVRAIHCFLYGYEKSASFTDSKDVTIRTFSELVAALRDQFHEYQNVLKDSKSDVVEFQSHSS